jgi:hypothetical protein
MNPGLHKYFDMVNGRFETDFMKMQNPESLQSGACYEKVCEVASEHDF